MIKDKIYILFLKEFKEKNLNNFLKLSMLNYLKWDSMAHVNLIIKIEKKFKVKFKTDEIFKLNSVKKIISYLKTHAKN